MKETTKPVAIILVSWLCFVLAVGVAGWFQRASAAGVAATLWILTAAALLACWKLNFIRAWVEDVDLRWLVGFHLIRFVGIYFLLLGGDGRLPLSFAQPAGVGDITIAALAGIILLIPKLHRRKIILAWNALGLIDILFVVFSALYFGLADWKSMAPLRELPLSLLPMFLVPLIITTHVIIFVRLRKRRYA